MKLKLAFLVLLSLVFMRLNLVHADSSTFKQLSENEKKVVETLLDEFKKHHMVYLEELSDDPHILRACSGITEDAIVQGGKGHQHEHDMDYKNECLAARVLKATPDANGKFLTPTFTGPDKTGNLTNYTYKELYTVFIEGKKIIVTMTRAEEGKPERQKAMSDKEFIEGLATSLKGMVDEVIWK